MRSHSESNIESLLKLFSLVGKTAVVTGGTRGIGQVIAIAFAEAGADIILIQVCKDIRPIYKTRRPLTDASAT
jgi:NAD(P)-dependent dehydrogenase (short-subunit alcohol dehydrogenase family)